MRSGRVTLRVPTNLTRGLYFGVSCSGDVCNSSNAAPVVALRYPAYAPGTTVPDSGAKAQKQASACWAGTSVAAVTIPLTMTVFPDVILTRQAHSIRVWANPQVAVVPGTWLATYKGGLGTQAIIVC